MEKLKMDHILKIMEQFEKTSIDTLQYKNDGEEILLTKNKNGTKASFSSNKDDVNQLKEISQSEPGTTEEIKPEKEQANQEATKEEQEEGKPVEDQENLTTVESPIIGTFYGASAPGKPPFVKKGDKIKEGDVLCIVEAMKVMNKIESEFSGEIVDICIEDGSPVEYGTCLFKIKPE